MSELLDLFSDELGELEIGHDGDLMVARDDDVLAQEALWRAKTTKGDWLLVPECGADLEHLIGEPNSPDTGAQMEEQLSEALTNDGFFAGRLKGVRAVPLNEEQLLGLVELEGIDAEFDLTVVLDLKQGVLG